MIYDQDAEHLVYSAGDPQEEPGDCTNLGERRRRWWRFEGWCHGCKSWQPITLTMFGWRLNEHTPAPPAYHADANGHPYPYPSYTQPDCDDCAMATDYAAAARGDGTAPYSDSGVDTGWGYGVE